MLRHFCLLLALLCPVLSAAAPAETGALANPSTTLLVPALNWSPCTGQGQAGFDCAMAQVPLDYTDPASSSVTLSVIRHAATDGAQRIGTLFMNPGGPGGQGTVDLPDWIALFSPTMRARFDIISWDPRGIGDSTAVQCFANPDDEAKFFEGVPYNAFPVGSAQKRAWLDRFETYGSICLQRNGRCCHTPRQSTRRWTWTCCAKRWENRRSTISAPHTAHSWARCMPTCSRPTSGR